MLEYETVSLRVYNKNIWEFCNSNRFLVSVVVVTHQREENLSNVLYSIVKQKTDFDFEIVIVDDASSDGTEEVIEKECHEFIQNKRVKHIKICTRLGYTKPSYIGAAAADGKIIVFQPSDMVPISPNGRLQNRCIQKLVDALDDDTIVTFAKECAVVSFQENDYLQNWRENPGGLLDLRRKRYATCKEESWFALGAIRWIDYRRLTDFRAPYPDSRLSAELNKDGRDIKFLDDIIAIHFPHKPSNLKGISQHWWTQLAEPP